MNSHLLRQIHGRDSVKDVALVVENCSTTRAILEEFVPAALPGYRVEFVESAQEAISNVTGDLKGRVAIVITDIEMPGMNGLEMVRRLKVNDKDPEAVEGMRHVPILVSSENARYMSRKTDEFHALDVLRKAGVVDRFKKKPFEDYNSVQTAIHKTICRMHTRIHEEALGH